MGVREQKVLYETQGAVAIIRLNRPASNNAFNSAMRMALNKALADAEADEAVRVIVLTGAGKLFSAGVDIDELATIEDADDARNQNYLADDWAFIDSCEKPIIAAVAGYAVGGGCELALKCDLVIAGDNARFGQPEIKLGLLPGGGATQRLPRIIGKFSAMELCLTGKLLTAREAERCGLANKVVATDKLLDSALEMAHQIAQYSLPIIKSIKKAIKAAQNLPLDAGLSAERDLFHAAFDLHDKKEGVKAFQQKRPPNFKHR